jgi:hypothetical protein
MVILVKFKAIWYIYISPFLVCFTTKNLATLATDCRREMLRRMMLTHSMNNAIIRVTRLDDFFVTQVYFGQSFLDDRSSLKMWAVFCTDTYMTCIA